MPSSNEFRLHLRQPMRRPGSWCAPLGPFISARDVLYVLLPLPVVRFARGVWVSLSNSPPCTLTRRLIRPLLLLSFWVPRFSPDGGQVEFDNCADTPHLVWNGDVYNLLQMHIHSPSEYKVRQEELLRGWCRNNLSRCKYYRFQGIPFNFDFRK